MITVAPQRLTRWLANFESRHGDTTLSVADGALGGTALDGSEFTARLPFDREYAGAGSMSDFASAAAAPPAWGLLLVRKGGFAVARLTGVQIQTHKIGRRHVQGRTKAGGQSQQRFARRRANQARSAYQAAADHAARILAGLPGPVVGGGDRAALAEVLTDPRLGELAVCTAVLDVPDPDRRTLDGAILAALGCRVQVINTDQPA